MSSSAAPRCRHIKVSGAQCGSPALRHKKFCFYHQQNRPKLVDCYYKPDEYPTGLIALPAFEDAHSIQTTIRQVVQMVLQKCLEQKTASIVLYALQVASSNLKRMELEKPQPEQVVIDLENNDLETESDNPMAAIVANEIIQTPDADQAHNENESGEDLLLGTIQACYSPDPLRPISRALRRAIPRTMRRTIQ